MSPRAAFHIGYVCTAHGNTPFGVNLLGVTFEDGSYGVLEALGGSKARNWEANVLEALRQGQESGESHGIAWTVKVEAAFPPDLGALPVAATAKQLLDALNRLQAFPNDPEAHRQALDAIESAKAINDGSVVAAFSAAILAEVANMGLPADTVSPAMLESMAADMADDAHDRIHACTKEAH